MSTSDIDAILRNDQVLTEVSNEIYDDIDKDHSGTIDMLEFRYHFMGKYVPN